MSRRHHRSSRHHRSRPAAGQSPWFFSACEPLERRFALAVTWSDGTWTITGDADPARPDDTIVVERDPNDVRRLRAVVDGVVVGSRLESTVRVIRVFGGQGDDTITIDLPDNTRIRTVLRGGLGDDVLTGGAGRDTIHGGPGTDTIVGGAGQDVVHGGDGDDSIAGGAGADTLYGGPGADTLRAGGGRNELYGGLGRDSFFGRRGVDRARLAADEQLIGNESTNPLRRLDDMALLQTWYVDAAMARWGEQLGREASPWRVWPMGGDLRGDTELATTMAGATQAGDFSGTNTQVAGVDEGDMVKTDGTHLFVLAGDGVDILAARPADQLRVVGHLATPGWERALYLSGTRLTVISDDSSWSTVADTAAGSASDARLAWWGGNWQPGVVVTVVDVSVPAAPVILETTRLDGWLVDSRAIEGRVLVVTQDSFDIPAPAVIAIAPDGTESERLPPGVGEPVVAATIDADGIAIDGADPLPGTTSISAMPPWWRDAPGDGTRYVYEDEASYRARLDQAWATAAIPRFRVTDAAGGETDGDLVAPGRAYLPVNGSDDTLLSVVSFEVSDDVVGPDAVTSVAGVSGGVYASTSSLYVSAANVGNWWDATDVESTTNIYKFDLQQVDVPLVAMGAVPGTTLNQFSLDESHDGLLRVATTVGFGDSASSGVYVMAAAAGNLQTVGSVAGLAPGERIYSARFVGDVGYVSTFREVDPLFVIDLADPRAPRVAGELKVPGYSSYLHPLDATHLLGIGRDVDATSGEVRGLQLSVFDVSRPDQPRRTATYTFPGTGWESWSEALWDHHAVSWFPEQRILAIPVQQGDWWSGSDGLVVFRVDLGAAAGFTNLGLISHDGPVQRSLRIGEFIYSVSAGQVQVHRLDDPTAEVARTSLTATPQDRGPWPVG